MRHIWIRGIAGAVWLAAAVVSAVSGMAATAVLYGALAVIFLHSAYKLWQDGQQNKGGH